METYFTVCLISIGTNLGTNFTRITYTVRPSKIGDYCTKSALSQFAQYMCFQEPCFSDNSALSNFCPPPPQKKTPYIIIVLPIDKG